MKKNYAMIILGITILLLSACSTGSSTDISPQIEAGMQTFQAYCSACHLTEGTQVLVGPALEGLASRAGNTVAGMDAESYIWESILDPGAHVNEGFTNLMPPVYGTTLSEEDLDALVAYLLTFN